MMLVKAAYVRWNDQRTCDRGRATTTTISAYHFTPQMHFFVSQTKKGSSFSYFDLDLFWIFTSNNGEIL